MGFFSAVKRMFGGQPKPEAAPPVPEKAAPEVAPDTVPEAGPDLAAAPVAEAAPPAESVPADMAESAAADEAAEAGAVDKAAPEAAQEVFEQEVPEQEARAQDVAASQPDLAPAAAEEVADAASPDVIGPDITGPDLTAPESVTAEPAGPEPVESAGVTPDAAAQDATGQDATGSEAASPADATGEEQSAASSVAPEPEGLAEQVAEAVADVPEDVQEDVQEEVASPPPAPASSGPASEEEAALLLRLREAEPRLSVWLGIVLEGVEQAGDLLWQRLTFLLHSLEAPPAEVDAFVADFRDWLARMEYFHVEEFRSELQYRLALALELEDEEDERSRLFLKISEGLSRTREQLSRGLDALFAGHGELNETFWEELEELFIMADLGYEPALELVERLRERARKAGAQRAGEVRGLLMAELEEIFRIPPRIVAVNRPEVVLFIGVNGVGKTTTIAKLAHRARMQGRKVMIAAADTFRAAAIEQLQVWAERVGAIFHARAAGADPAAVAYEAVERAVRENVDLLLVDTAGRLQTKVNLMEELGKIRQVLGKKHPGAPHRSILVLDATTGQNALSQTKLFKEAAGVDELILTKLDGTAKGGVAIAVAMQHALPITYVGLGEKMEDLRPFNGEDYARALLGETADSTGS